MGFNEVKIIFTFTVVMTFERSVPEVRMRLNANLISFNLINVVNKFHNLKFVKIVAF